MLAAVQHDPWQSEIIYKDLNKLAFWEHSSPAKTNVAKTILIKPISNHKKTIF